MNLKSFTKKVSAGLNMSHLPNLTGDPDKKAKQEAEQRKANINEVLLTLEDVHLQCPPSHSGLILAFAGTTLSPIMNPGIKFTWFRMTPEREDGSGGGGIEQVLESLDAWYAPTVDDVGCMICAQVEDNYEQGYSRYYEVRSMVGEWVSEWFGQRFRVSASVVSVYGCGRLPADCVNGIGIMHCS